MVKNHPFVDANKRTAWLVTYLLIDRSGYTLEMLPSDRIDDLVVAVAEDQMLFDEIAEWFKERLAKYKNTPL